VLQTLRYRARRYTTAFTTSAAVMLVLLIGLVGQPLPAVAAPPSEAPPNVQVTGTGSGFADLTWDEPDWGASLAKRYTVLVDGTAFPTCQNIATKACHVTGPVKKTVKLSVRALGDSPGEQVDSAQVTTTFLPSPDQPTGVTVTSTGSRTATITWTPPSSWRLSVNKTYDVLVDDAVVPDCQNISVTTCNITGNKGSHTAIVRAVGDPGLTRNSATKTFTLVVAPDAPTDLHLTASDAGSGTLAWTEPNWNDNVNQRYTVKIDGVAVDTCTNIATESCSFTADAITVRATVTSIGDASLSSESGAVTLTLLPAPDAPANIHPASWKRGGATVQWDAPSFNGSTSNTYTVLVGGDPVPACTGIIATSCEITGTPDSTVQVAVRANGDEGLATTSSEVGIDLPDFPAAPTDLKVDSRTLGHTIISWTAPGNWRHNAANMKYDVLVDGVAVADCTGLSATTCDITGHKDSNVSVVVRAVGNAPTIVKDSAPMPVDVPDVPGVPANVRASSTTGGAATVVWDAPDWHHNTKREYVVTVNGTPANCGDATVESCAITGSGSAMVAVQAIGDDAGTLSSAASTPVSIPLVAVPSGKVATVTVTVVPANPVVTVAWDALTDNSGDWNGGVTQRYTVAITSPAGAVLSNNGCAGPVAGLTCSFTTSADGEYRVRVTAVNEAGPSTQNTEGTATLVLHKPTGKVPDLTVTTNPGNDSVTVSWTPLATGGWHGATTKKYVVTIDTPAGTPLGVDNCTGPPMTGTSCTFTAPIAGEYTAHVAAVSEAGTSADVQDAAGTVALVKPSAAVGSLTATPKPGTGEVAITWTGLQATEWEGAIHHYKVDVTGPGNGETLTPNTCPALATDNATVATGCTFTTDKAGDYTVKVTAVNEVGESASSDSDVAHVTLSAPTGAVANLALTNSTGSGQVDVGWDLLPGPNWNDAETRTYIVKVSGPPGAALNPNTCTTGAITDPTQQCSFTTDLPGDYTVQVIAKSEAGESSSVAEKVKHVTLAAPSGTVTNLGIENTAGSSSVKVTWDRLGEAGWASGEDRSYKVTYTNADGSATACAKVVDGTTPSCTFTIGTPGAYTVKVVAVNEVAASGNGPTKAGNIVLVPTVVVGNVTAATTDGNATAQVTWDRLTTPDWSGGITNNYLVTIDKPAGATVTGTCTAPVADAPNPGCSFTGVIGGDYVIKVVPTNEAGTGTGTPTPYTARLKLKPTAGVTGLRLLTSPGSGDVAVVWNRAANGDWNGGTTHNYAVTITPPAGGTINGDTDCTTVADATRPGCSFTGDKSGAYAVKVSLKTEAGTSDSGTSGTASLSVSPPTGKPATVTVTTTPKSGAVSVKWDTLAPEEWQGQTKTYVVAVTPPGGAAPLTQNTCAGAVADSSTPQCSFTTTTPGSYTVNVAAANEAGTSALSTDGNGHVTLAAPSAGVGNLTVGATGGSGVVNVSWSRVADAAWQSAQQRDYVVTVTSPAGAGALTSNTCTGGPVADAPNPHCSFTAVTAGDYLVYVTPRSEAGDGAEVSKTGHVTLVVPTGTVTGLTVGTVAGSGVVSVKWDQLPEADWSAGAARTYSVTTTAANPTANTCTSVPDGPSPSCTFTTDTAGPFTVEVFAVNEIGQAASGVTKNGVIAFRPTAVVGGLSATATGGAPEVNVDWDALADAGWRGGTVKAYRVTVDKPAGATLGQDLCTTSDVSDSVGSQCSFVASVGGDYTVRVVPVTEAGVSTGTAAEDTVHVVLAPVATVAGLKVTTSPGSRTVTASWDQAEAAKWNGGVTRSYAVTVQSPAGAQLTSNTCTTVVDTATPSCTFLVDRSGAYTIAVALKNEIGTAATTPASASGTVALGAPGVPTGVSGIAGTNAITVSWSAPANVGGGISSYTVSAAAEDYQTRTCEGTVVTSPCTISGLAAGVDYTLRVVAVGAEGDSAPGVGTTPVAPTGLPVAPVEVPDTAVPAGSATTTSGGTVTITGSGFAPGSTVVLTVFSTPVSLGTAVASPSGTINATVTLPPGTNAGSHTLLASGLDSQGEPVHLAKAVTVATTPPTTTPPTTTPPTTTAPTTTPPTTTPPTTTAPTTTPPTTTAPTTTPPTTTAPTTKPPATKPPAAPTGVRGTVRDNAITVSWSAPVDGTVTRYTATATTTSYPAGTCTATASTSCTISGLAAGAAYTLRVTATGPGGTSAAATGESRPVPTGKTLVPTGVPASDGQLGDAITISAGRQTTVTASGYRPGTKVLLNLFPGPVALTTATVTSAGRISATVFFPATTRAGRYTIVATGLATNGKARFLTQTVTVRGVTAAGSGPLRGASVGAGNSGGTVRGAGTATGDFHASSSGASEGDSTVASAATSALAVTGKAGGPVILAGVTFLLLGLALTAAGRPIRRRRR
jgi:hypothetical protein